MNASDAVRTKRAVRKFADQLLLDDVVSHPERGAQAAIVEK
jgi:hypothetical protein